MWSASRHTSYGDHLASARPGLEDNRRPTSAELVAVLSSTESYGDTRFVDIRETHMSWVFLTDDHVYKLKKPVRLPHLDFSTLEAREHNCRTEVHLNRRLADGIYLGVVPVTMDETGRPQLDGTGQIVDWLVKMHRLPEDRMLDAAIRAETVTVGEIEDVADLLVRFYQGLEPGGISAADYVARFEQQLALDRSVLTDGLFNLPDDLAEQVLGKLSRALSIYLPVLEDGVREGRIVEGHGDLRPEHICLLDPPIVIDCLEFSHNLRLVDPFDDVAYLALECAVLDAGWIGESMLPRLSDGLGIETPTGLIAFYMAFRASLRARLSLAHLLDPQPRTPEKWAPLAIRYLEFANAEIDRALSVRRRSV